MKLEQFFAAIAPFLEGRETHAQASRALFGASPDMLYANDVARLAIYGRFCRVHRFEALDSTFAETRAALVQLAGQPAWEALVADHFAAHPMHHAELNENGSEFPAFIASEAPARALPAWLPELADLEWWSFRTRIAPDDPRDAAPSNGPLRLGATVELRPYRHDLSAWLELAVPRAAPEARSNIVLFWRDLDLDTRFAEATPLELAILHALVEARPLAEAAARTGSTAEELEETVADLLAAGILLGQP